MLLLWSDNVRECPQRVREWEGYSRPGASQTIQQSRCVNVALKQQRSKVAGATYLRARNDGRARDCPCGKSTNSVDKLGGLKKCEERGLTTQEVRVIRQRGKDKQDNRSVDKVADHQNATTDVSQLNFASTDNEVAQGEVELSPGSLEVTEVAPFSAARESALTMAVRSADLLVGASGSGVSEVSAKETAAHTATSAAVQQDVVKTRDAGDIKNLCELEEPLVINAPSDVEDSTPPVAKSKACSGGQKEAARGSQARGSVKSAVSSRQMSGHQHSPGKRHQGFSGANACSFQKRFCAPQQRGRSLPRSSRPPYRNHGKDKVTLSAQEGV